MYYVKMFYDALKLNDYKEKVNEILLGVTYFKCEEKLEIVDYVYKSFCDAAMFYDEDDEKWAYCSTVKLSLYKLREKERRKRERKIKKEKIEKEKIEKEKIEKEKSTHLCKVVFIHDYKKHK